MDYFNSNSIQSVELTDQGGLNIKYDKGGQKTVKNEDISLELQKIKTELEKNGKKKLTKEELDQKLQELENQQKNQKQGGNKENRNLGLKIGLGCLVAVVLMGLIALAVKVRKNKSKKY